MLRSYGVSEYVLIDQFQHMYITGTSPVLRAMGALRAWQDSAETNLQGRLMMIESHDMLSVKPSCVSFFRVL